MSSTPIDGQDDVVTSANSSPMATLDNTNNIPEGYHQLQQLPDELDIFRVGSTFTGGEEYLKTAIKSVLGPYGINCVNLGSNCHNNKDNNTKEAFPHIRHTLFCGSCPTEVRSMDISKPGCCGFKYANSRHGASVRFLDNSA